MQTELIVVVAAVFASVALIAGSLASLALSRTAPELRRLRRLEPSNEPSVMVEKLHLSETPSPILQRLSDIVPKTPKDLSRLRRRLAGAGYDQFAALALFSFAQLALPIILGAPPILLVGGSAGWLTGMAAGLVGFVLPDLFLTRKTTQYRKSIQDGLPDALDLIIVCIEAGSSIDQAIMRASLDLEIARPAVARELKTVSTEVRAGIPRLEAFQNLAKRTGVEDVRALVTMLIQTDRFGTSIAQALRTYADTSRTRRTQNAEERAAKVGVKLVFPLVLCLVPALYIVCLGPVVVRIYRVML